MKNINKNTTPLAPHKKVSFLIENTKVFFNLYSQVRKRRVEVRRNKLIR